VGIIDRDEAINRAQEVGLDLVEVSPNSDPPVCRIIDYGKWLYEQKRRQRVSRKKSRHHASVLKEIRLKPETDKHDLDIKVNHAREFLEKGYRVQITMLFRGRQILHKDRGYEILEQIAKSLEALAKVERLATIANRKMTLILVPKK
jgi:translation initiation factor IF-3